MHWDSRGGHQVLVLAVDIEVSFILFGSRVWILPCVLTRGVEPGYFLQIAASPCALRRLKHNSLAGLMVFDPAQQQKIA
jgi:hypothetical protein